MINDFETQNAGGVAANDNALSNDDVVECLNDLIETCRDGQEGFREAAEGVESSEAKSLFIEYSQQRARFVGELQALVRELGGDAANEGSVAGALHRGWIDLKAAISGKDEHSILVECERGEDAAKAEYKEALEDNLPENVRDVVMRQYQSVLEAHNRVKALRDGTSTKDTASSTATGGGKGGY